MILYCAKVFDLVWQNNVAEWSFHFVHMKNSFHFPSAKYEFFVKKLPNFILIIEPNQFPKILDHFMLKIHLFVDISIFIGIFNIIDNFLPI
jgi:hypothetical protein